MLHILRLVTVGRLLSVPARDATGAAREVQVEPQGDTALLRFDSEPAGLGLRIHAQQRPSSAVTRRSGRISSELMARKA